VWNINRKKGIENVGEKSRNAERREGAECAPNIYKMSVERVKSGRFVIRLLLEEEISKIGETFDVCLLRSKFQEKPLKRVQSTQRNTKSL
jgi:hypothetical protein